MDKISPEEKYNDEKILQKKESISSVASKIGVYYTTVDKMVRNKAIGPSFFRKGHTYRTPAQKKPNCFRLPFWKGSLGYLCRHKISGMHRYSEDGL